MKNRVRHIPCRRFMSSPSRWLEREQVYELIRAKKAKRWREHLEDLATRDVPFTGWKP